MSETIKFRCKLSTTNPDAKLGLKIQLDSATQFETDHVTGVTDCAFEIPDTETSHEIVITMSGKTHDHTKIDADGNIVSDALLEISDIEIDEIAVSKLLFDQAKYSHDFNGTGAPGVHKFFGSMGCNGSVSVTFTTPFYLWLLENM